MRAGGRVRVDLSSRIVPVAMAQPPSRAEPNRGRVLGGRVTCSLSEREGEVR